MYGYADGNDYDTIGVHEYIDYQFDTKDSEAYFFEYAADDMADSENVSDVYVSDIETMEINGYEVKYLCKQYQYNNGNTQYPVEIISIGMSLNDTECLEIVDNRMNPKELGDVEEIVGRLAGECLEIQSVWGWQRRIEIVRNDRFLQSEPQVLGSQLGAKVGKDVSLSKYIVNELTDSSKAS